MSLATQASQDLLLAQERFNRSTQSLTEDLSGFIPAEGMMSTAQQIAHTARVIDWFIEGAFRPEGFDMNFEAQIAQVLAVHSIAAARDWLDRSIASALNLIATKTDAELLAPLPEGPIMACLPRVSIFSAITDHTAHHRGALTVYARLNNATPPDPYQS